jgi:two-component system, LytTR family, sensor kinase
MESKPSAAEHARGEGAVWRRWGFLAVVATLVGLLNFSVTVNDRRAEGVPGSPASPLMWEMTAAYAFLALLPPLLALIRRFPITRQTYRRRVPLHLLAFVPFSVCHTLLMWGSRSLLYRLLGWGAYDYGDMRYRFLMEAGKQLVAYVGVYAVVTILDYVGRESERELRAAHLERELVEARLTTLKMQLNPHFLFNTLHMIASHVRDPRAEAMIAHLSDFLRLTLRHSQAQEVPLATELDLLEAYLEIMKARFEDRLLVEQQIAPDAACALVPHLLLQPLVENAITHAMDDHRQPARLRLAAALCGQRLRLLVEDNGPGLAVPSGSVVGRGVGLTNTAERLRHLYGTEHSLSLTTPPGGGLRVEIELPFRPGRVDAREAP